MRTWLFMTIWLLHTLAVPADEAFDHRHAAFEAVLGKYTADGRVDYGALRENRQALEGYIESIGAVSRAVFDAWSLQQQLAFLINCYNAETIQLIIDHYPVDSIRDIGGWIRGPWDQPVATLFGESITLNTLEHKAIRDGYNEPRIHFALVCAAKGCPPLLGEAFTAERLDEQLDRQARAFLAQSGKNHVDSAQKTLYLSPIFRWYKGDFTKSGQNLSAYVMHFLSEADQAHLAGAEHVIKYTDYDWSLNDSAGG